MRSDMGQLIHDCGKAGQEHRQRGGKGRFKEKNRDPEFAPIWEPIGPRRRPRKYSGFNIRPLARYLEKQVGRPWDDVWAELRPTLSTYGELTEHVRNRVFWLVRLHAREIDGKVYKAVHECRGSRHWDEISGRRGDRLYVADDGILRMVEPKRRQKTAPEANLDRVVLEPLVELHRVDGIWYRFRLTKKPKYPTFQDDPAWWGIFNYDMTTGSIWPYDPSLRVRSKHQLSRREIRRLVPDALRKTP